MTIDGNTINITTEQEIQEAGGVRTRRITQQLSLPSGVQGHLVQTSVREGELVITAPRGEWTVENNDSQSKLARPSSIPITIGQEEPSSIPKQSSVTVRAKGKKTDSPSNLGRPISIPITIEQEEISPTLEQSSVPDRAKIVEKNYYDDYDYD